MTVSRGSMRSPSCSARTSSSSQPGVNSPSGPQRPAHSLQDRHRLVDAAEDRALLLEDLHEDLRPAPLRLEQVARQVEVLVGVVAGPELVDREAEDARVQAVADGRHRPHPRPERRVTDARALLDELRPHIRDERVLAAIAAVPAHGLRPRRPGGRGVGQPGAGDRLRPDDLPAAGRRADGRAARRPPRRPRARRGHRIRLPRGDPRGARRPRLVGRAPRRAQRHGGPRAGGGGRAGRRARRGRRLATACPRTAPTTRSTSRRRRPQDDLAPFEAQLAPGGRLIAPVVGRRRRQRLLLAEHGPGGVVRTPLDEVRFVPLVRD